MDIKRIRTVLLAVALSGVGAVPNAALADDTEIYTGESSIEGVNPNVLFILDTSGSMSSMDGESKDRLDRMKDALYGLLDSVDNVNIGLMRFTDPGGPVLFPVSAIDADANTIDSAGQPDVSVRVSDNDDDAEELVALAAGSPAGTVGQVILDSLFLEFPNTTAFGTEKSYTVQVNANEDDAEQSALFYNNTSTVLEMVSDGSGTRTVGYRFANFDTDTKDAVVTFAQMILTAQSERDGDLDLTFFGLRRGDMDPFPSTAGTGSACGVSHANSDIYCRLGLTGADYTGGLNTGNVTSFQPPGGNITNALVQWEEVPGTVNNGELESPDLSPIFQEIFAIAGWQAGTSDDDLGLFYTGTTASLRQIHSHNDDPSRAAELRVDYIPSGAAYGEQIVALRFRDVRIPQGVAITNAALELYPVAEDNQNVHVRISAEKVADAPVFLSGSALASSDRLSGRLASNGTVADVGWTLGSADKWKTEEPVQTPDIKNVIQEVTDQSGWCGGNDLVIFLHYTSGPVGTRRIFAHDADPSLAPVLRLDYDETSLSAGEGCITEEITRSVKTTSDDSEQWATSGDVFFTSGVMEMFTTSGGTRTNGIIFRNLPIFPGATIESAAIEFTANAAASAGAATITVQGELDDEVDAFADIDFNVSDRISGVSGTSATVTFSSPAVSANERFQTADLTSIVTEIIGLSTWDHGDEMAFIFTGSGLVETKTFDADPAQAASLKVRVRYNLGDVIASGSAKAAVVTVRERLKEIIADFTHYGWTPLIDTYYEGARYFLGQPVLWGASRGIGGATLERNTRLSHPGTYERPPGIVNYPSGCNADDTNLGADACRDQTLTGSPNYISPITESCQSNFIVVLTDGIANRNSSASMISSQIGASCLTSFTDGSTVTDGEACGVDLAKYLNETDLSATVDGNNNIVTYTIGFEISNQLLKDMAKAGEGKFFEAGTEAELVDVFAAIITDVLSRATSFAAPSLSVNAFNRLEDRNEVYFSLFEPSTNARWNGNIKKYQLCRSTADGCGDVGSILDAQSPPVEAVGSDGRILDTALSFWSASADGSEVLEGGTGNEVPSHLTRNVYTVIDNTGRLSGTGNDSFFPSPIGLDALQDADGEAGTIDAMTGGTTLDRKTRTVELLGLGGATDAEIRDQINWIRGQDVDDLFEGVDRYSFSDPLHGNPLAITFGGTDADPIIKLFAATNDGGIRLINSFNGIEEWIFYPREMLPLQVTLRDNPATGKEYGVDGTATPWIQDSGTIGVIDPADGDFVRIFIGERRGGNRLYAMQLDPPSGGVTDKTSTSQVTPKLLWRITGGTTDFARLGQTWSRPVLATMLVGTSTTGEAVRKRVLIMGGGYEDAQDGGFGVATDAGNAIYVLDAETGARLYVISGPGSLAEHGMTSSDPGGKEVDTMLYPIPSDVAAFDSDGDNAVDRLYVGDTGGQVFRVDFTPDRTAVAGIKAVVGKIAELSRDDAPADQRKIFYPPTVVQVRGVGTFSSSDYDLIGIVTGIAHIRWISRCMIASTLYATILSMR